MIPNTHTLQQESHPTMRLSKSLTILRIKDVKHDLETVRYPIKSIISSNTVKTANLVSEF